MNIRKKRLRGGKMNYNKIEERLKEKVKELKGEERRLDVFKHLTNSRTSRRVIGKCRNSY